MILKSNELVYRLLTRAQKGFQSACELCTHFEDCEDGNAGNDLICPVHQAFNDLDAVIYLAKNKWIGG